MTDVMFEGPLPPGLFRLVLLGFPTSNVQGLSSHKNSHPTVPYPGLS